MDGDQMGRSAQDLWRMPEGINERSLQVALGNDRWINLAVSINHWLFSAFRNIRALYSRLRAHVDAHPGFYKTILPVGGIAVLISTILLPVLGFSAVGPVAGSIAAGWQDSLGSVAAGSLFAFFQSAAMGGAAAALFTGIGVSGAAALAWPAVVYLRPWEVGSSIRESAKKAGKRIGDAWRGVGEALKNWKNTK